MNLDLDLHVETFNAAVLQGDWSAFIDRFRSDAVVEFVGPPVGPFVGRDAIAEAYTTSPPDDTIEVTGPLRAEGDEQVVPYRWMTSGATGTMRFVANDDVIERLTITFD